MVCQPQTSTESPFLNQPVALFLETLTQSIIEEDYRISREEALRIAHLDANDSMLLFHYAGKLREHYRGSHVGLCTIVNAKSGSCSEDCTFCAQSAHFKTESPVYALMDPEEVIERARIAKADGAHAFGIVISGYGLNRRSELERVGELIRRVKAEVDIDVHGSFGILDAEAVAYLKDCGVTMINHNLETSERNYTNICKTHSFQERINTIRAVKEAGLNSCVGGIFGMQETVEDRVDMALQIRDLDVDVVPLNFLHPIAGTPLAEVTPLPPVECLRIIALYRFVLPRKELKICGGREKNLRDLQSMIFFAGADSMMIGNYLTTAGREPEVDHQMLRDLELTWDGMERA